MKPEIFARMVNVIPEGQSGDYSIRHYRGTCSLWIKTEFGPGKIIMSDNPFVKESYKDIVPKCHGQILMAGLGIGLMYTVICKIPEVKHVTVLENSKDVINLVEPRLRIYLGKDSDKLSIINADVATFKTDQVFDVVYFDIWETFDPNNYPSMKELQKRYHGNLNYNNPLRWMGSWMRWETRREYYKLKRGINGKNR